MSANNPKWDNLPDEELIIPSPASSDTITPLKTNPSTNIINQLQSNFDNFQDSTLPGETIRLKKDGTPKKKPGAKPGVISDYHKNPKTYLSRHKQPDFTLKPIDRRFKPLSERQAEQEAINNYNPTDVKSIKNVLNNPCTDEIVRLNENIIPTQEEVDRINPSGKSSKMEGKSFQNGGKPGRPFKDGDIEDKLDLIKPTQLQQDNVRNLLIKAQKVNSIPNCPVFDTLQVKQQKFVEEYLLDYNSTKAVERAGYSEVGKASVGYRLLQHKKVQIAIVEKEKRLLSILEEKRTVNITYIIETIKENIQRAMQAKPVLDNKGKATGEYMWAGSVVVSSCKLLGEYLKMWGAGSQDRGQDKGTVVILPTINVSNTNNTQVINNK